MVVKTSRNAIIVGGGRVGRRTAASITNAGYTVTIIERDTEKQDILPQSPASRVIVGDGADVEVFKEANPTMADVVAGLTNDTDTNLAVCKLAKEIVPDARTLLRIGEDGAEDYAHLNYVDAIVYPAAAGARVATSQITGGNVR
ncbi:MULTISPECIES: NAD-binding protein [Salinibaculum]|uniref:NAD-binding protein n=1 Tax=Salinibaculum TaxID=2732368 RepID=UPI0030D5760F